MTLTNENIANMALARMGGDPKIVSLTTDTSNEAAKVNLFFTQTRDALVRSHNWKFALTEDTLDLDVTGSSTTVSAADDTITTSYLLTAGMPVYLTAAAMPTGFVASTIYYAINPSGTTTFTCQLAATVGGAVLDFTDTGTTVVANIPTQTTVTDWPYVWDFPTGMLRMLSVEDGDYKTANGHMYTSAYDAPEISFIQQVTDPTKFDTLFTEAFVLDLALKLIPPLKGMGGAALASAESIKNDYKKVISDARMTNAIEVDLTEWTVPVSWNEARSVNIGGE